jgi:hypothetical protein
MKKTRFYQFTASELDMMLEYLYRYLPKFEESNLKSIVKEIQDQIYFNEWEKKKLEIQKSILIIDDRINILKNQLEVELKRKDDLNKLLNK